MAAIRTRHIPGTPGFAVDEAGTGELVLFSIGGRIAALKLRAV